MNTQRLNIPVLAIIAFLTAAVLTFIAFTVGGIAWLLASPPAALVYIVVFGVLFISAFNRSPSLPHQSVLRFALPTICSLALVIASGWAGIRTAYLANDAIFHIAVKEFHS